jgi:hypothetical protein
MAYLYSTQCKLSQTVRTSDLFQLQFWNLMNSIALLDGLDLSDMTRSVILQRFTLLLQSVLSRPQATPTTIPPRNLNTTRYEEIDYSSKI